VVAVGGSTSPRTKIAMNPAADDGHHQHHVTGEGNPSPPVLVLLQPPETTLREELRSTSGASFRNEE
jgi:hypothetical protein